MQLNKFEWRARMTDGEKRAREIINVLYFGYDGKSPGERILFIFKAAKDLPKLTDEECRSIAREWPFSFREIRTTFPAEH